MATSTKNSRLYGVLKFHRSQPTMYSDVRECSICLTVYPCMTVQIAKGTAVWDFNLEKFVAKVKDSE